MSSLAEMAAGALVEVFIFGAVCIVLYRTLAGKFLIPKREMVLPNQRGVVVQGGAVVRVAQPGICWVRPRQKLILLDARPRPLQFLGLEVLCSDNGVVRLSATGEFRLADPETYYQGSTSANEAFLTEVRMNVMEAARKLSCPTLVSAPQLLEKAVSQGMKAREQTLGLTLVTFEVREAVFFGQLNQTLTESQSPTTVQ